MRKWNKIAFIVVVLFGFIITTAHAATEVIKVYIVNTSIFLNNTLLHDIQLLNYKGQIFVPIRKFAEISEASIEYDSESKHINIDKSTTAPVLSEINHSAVNDEFALRIISERENYAEGNSIRIWSRLENIKGDTTVIYHGGPLIRYRINDEYGFEDSLLSGLILENSTFGPGDEYSSTLLIEDIIKYNKNKGVKNNLRTTILEDGDYTITAEVIYKLNGSESSKVKLNASINISVK